MALARSVTYGHVPGDDTLPRPDRYRDADAQARVCGLFADLLDVDRVEDEDHAVLGVDVRRVSYDLGEMAGVNVRADGIRVNIFRRAPNPVGTEENATLENEVVRVCRAAQSVYEGFEGVSDQVLLCGRPGPGLCCCRTGASLKFSEDCVACCHANISNACRTGDFARGRRIAISISGAGFPPRRSHSRSAPRANS